MTGAIALLLICLSSASPQNTLEIRFVGEPDRNTHIGIFERAGVLYGSLNDLTAAFRLNATVLLLNRTIELRGGKYSIRANANNPFVVLIGRDSNASVVQLPVNVLFAAGTFFVPLESFVPIIDAVLDEEIVFNPEQQLIAVGPVPPKPKYDIETLTFDQRSNGTLVRIFLNKKIKDYESWLKPIQRDDDTKAEPSYWLYVTLADATVDTAALNTIKPGGVIKQILIFQTPTSTQLTFRLSGEITSTELLDDENSNDLLLTIHSPTPEEIALKRRREIEKYLARERGKWKLDVIVIDAGHGGEDPGAVGVSRVQEKDVTLAIALKLGKLIEKQLQGVKAIYTRTKDQFVELYRRGQIANQANGKLFISIHCNSMPHKPDPTNGFEIYLLRPGQTEHALQIAERENAVVKLEEGYEKRYQQLTEENFILLTMAQSAYVKYSEQFADILQQEMEVHSDLENQGVKQAGFYVLVGASMPNVLVETGYLSNRSEERFLKSRSGQEKIANGIFNAIRRYKEEYEKYLQEGKMVGTPGN